MKLSKEQKAELIGELNMPWGQVKLRCDGYVVDLQIVRKSAKSLSYCVSVYINGVFKGIWVSDKESHPEQKFLRKTVKKLYSPKQMVLFEKACGKREAKKHQKEMTFYMGHFNTGSAAINHLCRVCDSIEILDALAVPETSSEEAVAA